MPDWLLEHLWHRPKLALDDKPQIRELNISLNTVISFVMVAFAAFLLVQVVHRLKDREK